MPKSLKDILQGVKKSKIETLTLGKQPGVDYQPKSKAEQDFVAQHKIEKHEDRVGNGDDVYKGTTKYALDKENKHGHKKPTDVSKYDQVKESLKCNMTEEGEHCPIHENGACPTKKTLQEIRNKINPRGNKKPILPEVNAPYSGGIDMSSGAVGNKLPNLSVSAVNGRNV